LTVFHYCSIFVPKSSGKEGTVSLAKPHCRNSWQRLRDERLANSFPGSLLHNPWTLRPKRLQWLNNLSGKHLNGTLFCARRLVSPSRFEDLKQPCDLGLCKSVSLAKIAASLRVKASSLHHCRASAQSFSQICIRAEARRGYFPLLALQASGIASLRGDAGHLALQHQTGPP
jgi:hypothetical protein